MLDPRSRPSVSNSYSKPSRRFPGSESSLSDFIHIQRETPTGSSCDWRPKTGSFATCPPAARHPSGDRVSTYVRGDGTGTRRLSLYVGTEPESLVSRRLIVELAEKDRLPAITRTASMSKPVVSCPTRSTLWICLPMRRGALLKSLMVHRGGHSYLSGGEVRVGH